MCSVSRTREIDRDGAKADRKGFTLSPDHSSTAFMMQGATLAAAIAGCGDAFGHAGLTEMITPYVVLSRARTADALLLLRVFANAISLGAPPRPTLPTEAIEEPVVQSR